jgi:hypothetical protein
METVKYTNHFNVKYFFKNRKIKIMVWKIYHKITYFSLHIFYLLFFNHIGYE